METTIRISQEVKKNLDKMKIYERESYNDIIELLLEDNKEINTKTKKELEKARKRKEFRTKKLKKDLGYNVSDRMEEGAVKQLDKLPHQISARIIKKVEELYENPFSKDIKKLKGEHAFRLRVGDYRIIFDIDMNKKIIYILRLGHRKNIYNK